MTSLQVEIPRKYRNSDPTKTVGLVSDTHVPRRARRIPVEVFKVFKNAEYIVHAGDLVELSVIDTLEQIAPVLAVHGNMDGPETRNRLPRMNSFKFFDWKIGVMHDPATLFGMRRMCEIARENDFDVFVYGHTHNPHVEWKENTLFINPGSPTNPIPPFLVKASVGLLKITKEKISPEIVRI